jgi:hypothetical protein
MFRVYGKIDQDMDPGLFVYSSMATMASDSHASSYMYGQTGIPGIRDFREFAACMIAYRPNYSKIVNLANPCIDHVILWGGNNWRCVDYRRQIFSWRQFPYSGTRSAA